MHGRQKRWQQDSSSASGTSGKPPLEGEKSSKQIGQVFCSATQSGAFVRVFVGAVITVVDRDLFTVISLPAWRVQISWMLESDPQNLSRWHEWVWKKTTTEFYFGGKYWMAAAVKGHYTLRASSFQAHRSHVNVRWLHCAQRPFLYQCYHIHLKFPTAQHSFDVRREKGKGILKHTKRCNSQRSWFLRQ